MCVEWAVQYRRADMAHGAGKVFLVTGSDLEDGQGITLCGCEPRSEMSQGEQKAQDAACKELW